MCVTCVTWSASAHRGQQSYLELPDDDRDESDDDDDDNDDREREFEDKLKAWLETPRIKIQAPILRQTVLCSAVSLNIMTLNYAWHTRLYQRRHTS